MLFIPVLDGNAGVQYLHDATCSTVAVSEESTWTWTYKLCFLQDLSTSKSPKLVYGSEHLALGGIRVEYVKVASVL